MTTIDQICSGIVRDPIAPTVEMILSVFQSDEVQSVFGDAMIWKPMVLPSTTKRSDPIEMTNRLLRRTMCSEPGTLVDVTLASFTAIIFRYGDV